MQKDIKPHYVFWSTTATLLIIGLLSILLSSHPLQIAHIQISLPNPASIIETPQAEYTKIDTLINKVLDDIYIETSQTRLTKPNIDSLPSAATSRTIETKDSGNNNSTVEEKVLKMREAPQSTQISESDIKLRVQKIELPPNATQLLDYFYNSLKTETNKRNIRVLHYGDSQIEGDRITGYLRHRFQETFGGSGPGLLFCNKPVAEHATVIQTASDNWQSDNVMQKNDTSINKISYGIMGQTNHFTDTPPQQARLSYRLSPMSYPTARRYNWCRIFIGYSDSPLDIEVYGRDSILLQDQIILDEPLNIFGFQIDKPTDNIQFRFTSNHSPAFYALTLDQAVGVTVDNIPWRGSSGAEFSKIDKQLLSYFFKQLNVRLIIFQFGVNVVPNIVKSYGWYEEIIVKQLQHLRTAAGNTPIIVVGVSDMARKRETWYESYPNIPAIRDAQRNAAFRTGCAFWDMYEAMGGKNSMVAWVQSTPPLANKDFVHFNPKGSKIISHMLYKAIMENYE